MTPHPDTFLCGIRWPDGDANGSGKRWRYPRVWIDPYVEDGVRTIRLGKQQTLRLRVDANAEWTGEGPKPLSGHVVLAGRTADTGTQVLLAVPVGQLARFGAAGL